MTAMAESERSLRESGERVLPQKTAPPANLTTGNGLISGRLAVGYADSKWGEVRYRASKARASLRFWARVRITVGRIATFMPRARMAGACEASRWSITKVPVKSA